MIPLKDRYLGCLIGLACGDALGGPVEFESRAKMDEQYPLGLRDFVGGGWLKLFPGEITDDTQMTLDVARSLVAHPDGDMDDLAGRFLAWRNSDPKDIGNTTRDALDRLARGVPWDEAGEEAHISRGPRDSAGNGAIMRCAPVAMRFRTEPDRLRAISIDVSRITHANPLCTWASVAIDQAIAALLSGASVRQAIEQASASIPDEQVRSAIAHASSELRDEIKSGGFVHRHAQRGALVARSNHQLRRGPGSRRRSWGRYRHDRSRDRSVGWRALRSRRHSGTLELQGPIPGRAHPTGGRADASQRMLRFERP